MGLQNRLHAGVNQAGTPNVKSDAESGLLYCFISAGSYATVAAARTAMIGYLGKEHAALKVLDRIRKDGE